VCIVHEGGKPRPTRPVRVVRRRPG
jgi:hypothetical protein